MFVYHESFLLVSDKSLCQVRNSARRTCGGKFGQFPVRAGSRCIVILRRAAGRRTGTGSSADWDGPVTTGVEPEAGDELPDEVVPGVELPVGDPVTTLLPEEEPGEVVPEVPGVEVPVLPETVLPPPV